MPLASGRGSTRLASRYDLYPFQQQPTRRRPHRCRTWIVCLRISARLPGIFKTRLVQTTSSATQYLRSWFRLHQGQKQAWQRASYMSKYFCLDTVPSMLVQRRSSIVSLNPLVTRRIWMYSRLTSDKGWPYTSFDTLVLLALEYYHILLDYRKFLRHFCITKPLQRFVRGATTILFEPECEHECEHDIDHRSGIIWQPPLLNRTAHVEAHFPGLYWGSYSPSSNPGESLRRSYPFYSGRLAFVNYVGCV